MATGAFYAALVGSILVGVSGILCGYVHGVRQMYRELVNDDVYELRTINWAAWALPMLTGMALISWAITR